ncbi:MAG: UvrD-helicase domain-containing protein [Treponema sp.]|jgi:uncharacterized protein (TIGR00375 family)|nr:UvrD-helicase domain-containing protein [Treponema sp.]
MMRIIADLHIHSRFSRATSKKLSPPYLDRWARIKGIGLLGTGDCTHPQWLAELREHLEEEGEGFYALKERLRAEFDAGPALAAELPAPSGAFPRFVLSGEISTIYKKGGAVRKVHHLVILPDFKAAASFQTRLEKRGANIRSDGRPILGMDSRELFEILLDTDERSLLIPAHIWTPWFSVLGARSGFDSIDECYGDLTGFIPAVETGLSSNPPMNWAVSSLDRFAVISNSDAHSPEKLGREAVIFDMSLDYPSLRRAVWSVAAAGQAEGNRIVETIEFFPQEGKYHYDGHRKCGISLAPEEAAALNGICPVCGEKLTRGVMGRVLDLAEGPVDERMPCPPVVEGAANRRPYRSLIPLSELLGELLRTGPASKKVRAAYNALIQKAGNEFALLMDMDAGEIAALDCPALAGEFLAAAVSRMRSGDVSVSPGYDGEYGVVRAFPPGDEADFFRGTGLFVPSEGLRKTQAPQKETPGRADLAFMSVDASVQPLRDHRFVEPRSHGCLEFYNSSCCRTDIGSPSQNPYAPSPDQEAALSYGGRYAAIIAGPGAGKTAVLSGRIARLIREGRDPASILALSFTVKAAGELRDRITGMLPEKAAGIDCGIRASTFHSFCCALLREQPPGRGIPVDFTVLSESGRNKILEAAAGTVRGKKVRSLGLTLGNYIEGRKRFLLLPGETSPLLGANNTDSPFLSSLPRLAEAFGLEEPDPETEILYETYRGLLREKALLDFDDLVAGAARLLAGNRELLSKYRARYRYILIDEYQDVNFAQYVLVRLLAPTVKETVEEAGGEGESELRVIGDPNQAIYGFRGADKRFLDRFTEDYPGAALFYLSRSFRCGEAIIKAAGHLTGAFLAGTSRTASLFRSEYPTEKSEAEGIARRIVRLIGGTSFFAMDSGTAEPGAEELTSLGECAILLRTSALAGPIIKALSDHGIPFEVTGEHPWWEAEPVRTVLNRMRETPGRFSGLVPAEAARRAWEDAEKDGGLKAALISASPGRGRGKREDSGEDPLYAERLFAMAKMYGNLAEFLDALASDGFAGGSGDCGLEKREALRVMTIHASKGLEFDYIFAPALEEGILPLTIYGGGNTGVDEEKRLLYVAMTRARQGLYLSWARTRMLNGRKLNAGPSRFLKNLEELIPLAETGKRKPRDTQGLLF